jgi:hypothetical protein
MQSAPTDSGRGALRAPIADGRGALRAPIADGRGALRAPIADQIDLAGRNSRRRFTDQQQAQRDLEVRERRRSAKAADYLESLYA